MKIFIVGLLLAIPFVQAAEKSVTRTMYDKDLKWGPCPEVFPKGCEISVLHGTPEKKGADVYLRVPSNYVIPAHTHTSAEHMTLVSGDMEIQYKGEKKFSLKQGAYAFGPAQVAHQGKCISKEPCVLFISFDEPIDSKAYSGTL